MGAIGVAITIGAVFWIYGRDLPSHESLSQYKPPTISRIYSVEGQIIDEFARERRLFTPAGEIPNSVKMPSYLQKIKIFTLILDMMFEV